MTIVMAGETMSDSAPRRSSVAVGSVNSMVGMMLKGDGACHLYLVYKDSGGQVAVLTPPKGTPANDGEVRKIFESPLDETKGQEVFWMIASREPLMGLEEAITTFRDGKDAEGKSLLGVVQALRVKHEPATVPPSKAVPIGGKVRGDPPESKARQFAVKDVFFQTLTIDHR